jgi:hypothetical protein
MIQNRECDKEKFLFINMEMIYSVYFYIQVVNCVEFINIQLVRIYYLCMQLGLLSCILF